MNCSHLNGLNICILKKYPVIVIYSDVYKQNKKWYIPMHIQLMKDRKINMKHPCG